MDVGVGVTMIAELMDLGTIVPREATSVFALVCTAKYTVCELGSLEHPRLNIPARMIPYKSNWPLSLRQGFIP